MVAAPQPDVDESVEVECDDVPYSLRLVPQLRAELGRRRLDVCGSKRELVARLTAHDVSGNRRAAPPAPPMPEVVEIDEDDNSEEEREYDPFDTASRVPQDDDDNEEDQDLQAGLSRMLSVSAGPTAEGMVKVPQPDTLVVPLRNCDPAGFGPPVEGSEQEASNGFETLAAAVDVEDDGDTEPPDEAPQLEDVEEDTAQADVEAPEEPVVDAGEGDELAGSDATVDDQPSAEFDNSGQDGLSVVIDDGPADAEEPGATQEETGAAQEEPGAAQDEAPAESASATREEMRSWLRGQLQDEGFLAELRGPKDYGKFLRWSKDFLDLEAVDAPVPPELRMPVCFKVRDANPNKPRGRRATPVAAVTVDDAPTPSASSAAGTAKVERSVAGAKAKHPGAPPASVTEFAPLAMLRSFAAQMSSMSGSVDREGLLQLGKGQVVFESDGARYPAFTLLPIREAEDQPGLLSLVSLWLLVVLGEKYEDQATPLLLERFNALRIESKYRSDLLDFLSGRSTTCSLLLQPDELSRVPTPTPVRLPLQPEQVLIPLRPDSLSFAGQSSPVPSEEGSGNEPKRKKQRDKGRANDTASDTKPKRKRRREKSPANNNDNNNATSESTVLPEKLSGKSASRPRIKRKVRRRRSERRSRTRRDSDEETRCSRSRERHRRRGSREREKNVDSRHPREWHKKTRDRGKDKDEDDGPARERNRGKWERDRERENRSFRDRYRENRERTKDRDEDVRGPRERQRERHEKEKDRDEDTRGARQRHRDRPEKEKDKSEKDKDRDEEAKPTRERQREHREKERERDEDTRTVRERDKDKAEKEKGSQEAVDGTAGKEADQKTDVAEDQAWSADLVATIKARAEAEIALYRAEAELTLFRNLEKELQGKLEAMDRDLLKQSEVDRQAEQDFQELLGMQAGGPQAKVSKSKIRVLDPLAHLLAPLALIGLPIAE